MTERVFDEHTRIKEGQVMIVGFHPHDEHIEVYWNLEPVRRRA